MAETPPSAFHAGSSGSRKAWSADSPILLRVGLLCFVIAATFGAGAWASTMASAIAQLTANGVKTEAKLEKLEGLMMEVLRAQPHKAIP